MGWVKTKEPRTVISVKDVSQGHDWKEPIFSGKVFYKKIRRQLGVSAIYTLEICPMYAYSGREHFVNPVERER